MQRNSAIVGLIALMLLGCSSGTTDNNPPQQFGTVRGTVTAAGTPVAGAAVALSRGGNEPRTANSAANGEYQFTQVATGTWSLGITPPGGYAVEGAASASVSVQADQVTTRNFTLQTGPPAQDLVEVTVGDNTFNPASVTVAVNTTVRWRNSGYAEHNTTSAQWTSPTLAPGASYDRMFTQAGTFSYACTLHAGMTGSITVQ